MTTGSTSVRNNHLPPSLVANLQSVLTGRNAGGEGQEGTPKPEPAEESAATSSSAAEPAESNLAPHESKPVVLVTNSDGIGAPGLAMLVDALVREGRFDVHVCAPESDRSLSGYSFTVRETLVASSTEINGAAAFEVTGTPVDCVSLALSGALFSWSKPTLVISGISKGANCGHHSFYSGAVAAAREALICGVPSVSVSLNWKKDESQESDFKAAADVCLPLIHAVIRDIEKGLFFKSCLLNIEIPSSPATNKGFKVAQQSVWRSTPSWQAVSGYRHPSAGQFMSKHQSLGVQLAQLSRDASAAGAARRLNAQRKTVEIESVAVAGKAETQHGIVKKYFRLEFQEKEHDDTDEDLDIRVVENGFVAVTPIYLPSSNVSESSLSVSEWLSSALCECEKSN
uniref:5'-nucleotidase surE n=1 Tax=Anthurium amnicola TaxID=1678845 RepID=A0A1D1Y4K4_9ARAE